MPFKINIVETSSSDCPAFFKDRVSNDLFPKIWAIGNLNILEKQLLGFFCSAKCPGAIILKTYDLIRDLRNKGVIVISGFHSPIEKDCLDFLIRGKQPIVICPARGIETMRIPKPWRMPIEKNRVLILSPFENKYRRPTVALAEHRNRFVKMLAYKILIACAANKSKTMQLFSKASTQGKEVYTLDKQNSSETIQYVDNVSFLANI
ncbi:MAG: DNA-processing protein DprA [Deltaproteobacteria bacterium]|nr:DNA-processing protein DprA [Deltaproteobacteria bacterium]